MPRLRLPALVLGAGLALVPSVALTPAAWAEGAILTPSGGTVYERDTTVDITARVEARSGATELRLVDPAGTARTVRRADTSLSDQTLRFGLETDCPAMGTDCTGRRPAPNGTWTVQLTGGATDSRTFELRIPPRAPETVRAEATSPRQVVVSWARGAEPDLVGYSVMSGDGRRLAAADSACSGGTCRATVTYDADGPSTESLAVRAERACPGCGTLTATSAPVSVSRPGPPPPPAPPAAGNGGASAGGTPSSSTSGAGSGAEGTPGAGGTDGSGGTEGATPAPGTPTGGTGASGSPSGSPSPGSDSGGPTGGGPGSGGTGTAAGPVLAGPGGVVPVAQQPDAFALSFNAFGPKLGLPKLPPLPASGVALPDVAPPVDGGYEGELPFDETVTSERVPTTASGPVGRVGEAVSSAIDSERLVRSTAAALVLLLVTAHVRRWLAQSPGEP